MEPYTGTIGPNDAIRVEGGVVVGVWEPKDNRITLDDVHAVLRSVRPGEGVYHDAVAIHNLLKNRGLAR